MKIHPHDRTERFTAVKPRRRTAPVQAFVTACVFAAMACLPIEPLFAQGGAASTQARALLDQVLQYLAEGPAFDAKVRESVWTAGREVVGVGTYEQAGGGSGRFHLQVTMHDGDGKHHFQQISDGRLAWTRVEIADSVSLRRVDVGRLGEWYQTSAARGHDPAADQPIPPRLMVGGWTEMLGLIRRDYAITAASYTLVDQPVWVITGDLLPERRQQILNDNGLGKWPELHPTRVRLAIAAKPNPETNFGQWLPVRIEFWSDPPEATSPDENDDDQTVGPVKPSRGRLITLVELYSIRPIAPPPIEKFRFDNQNAEVNFVNETDRYLKQYGIEVTQRDLQQLRR